MIRTRYEFSSRWAGLKEETMAKYCTEKFESGTKEKIVYWRQDKHVHNAALIKSVERWLGGQFGGTWTVRANSFRSAQPEPTADNAAEYTG
jgi:hypothetical protein